MSTERKLNIFYNLQKVGELTEDTDERLSFQYSKDWLDSENSFSLSLVLKLDDIIYGHIQTKSFFENLLPEGEVKKTLEKTTGKNISDDFSFLHEYGIDCAGALTIISEDQVTYPDKFLSKEISLKTIYDYLENKQSLTSAMINYEGGRFSLAGAQDKFPIIYKNKKIYLPQNGGATTHILKPFVRYHEGTLDSPYNEYFCMKLAAAVGLNTPKVFLIDGDYPLYVIERFDRIGEGSDIQRIHQQDFCQAQGITSRKKYEEDGGPGLAKNYDLIKSKSSSPIKDLSQFLSWFWFNLFIGNNDCHSKNLSFVHTNDGIRLAPFYDLLSTSIYKDLTKRFSYTIGKQWHWHKLKKGNLNSLAESIGVDNSLIFKSGKSMAKKMTLKLPSEVEMFESEFTNVATAKMIEKEAYKRIKYLQKLIDDLI